MTRRRAVCLALAVSLVPLLAAAQEDGGVPGGGRPLLGRVVDAEGHPLAGVEIWRPFTLQERMGRAERRPAAVSASDGVFQILNPVPFETLTACPAGWLYAQVHAFPDGRPVEIRLQPAARIAGRVVDERGEPVPGMRFTARLAGWSSGCIILTAPEPCPGNPRHRSGNTDADGRFALEGLEAGWFEIHLSGHGLSLMKRWQAVEGAAGRDMEIAVPGKLGWLEIRVVDADGEPVAGAQVDGVDGVYGSGTLTGPDGILRASRLLSGSLTLLVSHPDFGWTRQEVRLGETTARVEVRMPAATLVEGRILASDGSALPSPALSVEGRGVEVDTEGRFRFRVPPGEHKLFAQARDWLWAEPTITAAGQPIELDIELRRPAAVRGRITGLPQGELGAVMLDDDPEESSGWNVAEEDGRFRINMVAPGAWMLVARDNNGRTAERLIQVEEGQEVTVEDFHFSPLPEVQGRILDPEGRPAEGVDLELVQGELSLGAFTDATGSFTAHLTDGTWTVKAEKDGFGSVSTIVTMAGAPVKIPDLRLLRGVPVSGDIRGLAPGEIAWIRAESEDGLWRRGANADQDNRFALPDLWPGTWILTVGAGERETAIRVRILPQDTALRAELALEEE